ncbi:MAG: macro domain-containing protein [Collinsella sp.]|nr:macro domain-containing protein [Collinsella sp.]
MPLNIVRANIVDVAADAIVNSANPFPMIGSGVDSAIHEAAGPCLLEERQRVGNIAVGDAVATSAGKLAAKIVIHAVGPLWRGGSHGEIDAVKSCYRRSLEVACEHGCASIAFPLISTGAYRFPKDCALDAAMDAIGAFLLEHDLDVTLAVFDPASFQLSRRVVGEVETYIRDAESTASEWSGSVVFDPDDSCLEGRPQEAPALGALPASAGEEGLRWAPAGRVSVRRASAAPRPLEEVLAQMEETFSESLLRLIDERGLTDPEVYRRANLDRKHFSKIRSDAAYQPKKMTALALAIALHLNLDETLDLLGRAGYTLSRASKADCIIEYCILNGLHDVGEVNLLLFEFNQPLLGR